MLKNNDYEIRKINSRTKVLIFITFVLFSIITARVIYIQFVKGDELKKTAENNIKRVQYISPERGDIYDINNNPIAINKNIYSLYLIKENINGYKGGYTIRQEVLKSFIYSLSSLIEIENKDNLYEKIKNKPSFIEIPIKNNLTEKELSKIIENMDFYKGLLVKTEKVRNYPDNDLFFHITGYVSRTSKSDLDFYKDINLLSNDYIGKIGIEKYFNKELYGVIGEKEIKINADGRIKSQKIIHNSEKGKDIYLTIDKDIQSIAKNEMKHKGAVVAINVKTGDIIAYYSNPSYDPNNFINGISHSEMKLLNSSNSPLMDRVIQANYPPASTIKPFIGLAALTGKYITADENVKSGPYYQIGTHKFRDWVRWGHGDTDMIKSISRSVDVYYYRLGHKMGVDYMHDYLNNFYFGKKIPFSYKKNQSEGLLPNNKWKQKYFNEPFYAGEEVIIAIGQGQFLVTPLQLAYATKVLVNGGNAYELNFIKDKEPNLVDKIYLDKEHVDVIKKGMWEVVNGKRGTASAIKKLSKYELSGKTGTAQVFSTKGEIDYENEDMPENLRDHGLFIGFAPFDDPEIAIAVITEHAGSGSEFAAPIAAKIMNAYLEKKQIPLKKEKDLIDVE